MVRTQIQLTELQIEALRRLAAAQGTSMADLIRQSVEVYLKQPKKDTRQVKVQRALRAMGRFSSGSSDGSAKHDSHLAEAFR